MTGQSREMIAGYEVLTSLTGAKGKRPLGVFPAAAAAPNRSVFRDNCLNGECGQFSRKFLIKLTSYNSTQFGWVTRGGHSDWPTLQPDYPDGLSS